MRALASDLDRTLIYSHRFLQQYPSDKQLVLVENYQGKPHAYMSAMSVQRVAQLCEQEAFIPVTTRTTVQYQRIFGLTQLQPTFAITTNGAEILYKGEVDAQWAQHLKAQRNPHYAKMYQYMTALPGVERAYDVQHFMYAITTIAVTSETRQLAQEWGFNVSQQGRKLYFVPSYLTKWQATSYVAEKLGLTGIFAAGDSLLDMPLLEGAHQCLYMRHGTDHVNHLPTTVAVGIDATEEMLTVATNYIQNSSY